MQGSKDYWSNHMGEFSITYPKKGPTTYKGYMCPSGLALYHPAAGKLLQFETKVCPTMTRKPWTFNQMEKAIDLGPHVSALQPVAMEILAEEVATNNKKG